MGFFEEFNRNGYAQVWLYLLAINAVVFILQIALGNGFTLAFALTPALALTMPWTFITAAFLHGSFTHILFNMFSLFMFGPLLEQKIGSKRFLFLYLAGAIAGNIGMFLFNADSTIPGLGASGAIFAILGAMALLEPHLMIFLYFIPLPMWAAAIVWTVLEFLGTFNPASNIGHWAHLGGLFLGLAYAFYLRSKARDFEREAIVE